MPALGMGDVWKAKQIIDSFLENQIDELVKVLGRDHPYDVYEGETVGDIENAYHTISEWFSERD